MNHGSLFAGIGGFDLGFKRAGIKTVWQVEIKEERRRVLARHFPDAVRFADIRSCHAANADESGLRKEEQDIQAGESDTGGLSFVDIISGGFPCQPFSCAGKHRGKADDRYLWPEMRRIIEEIRPRWVVAENSPDLFRLALDTVLFDLEALGYTPWPLVIPACSLGAWHRRNRIWIVAHFAGDGRGAGRAGRSSGDCARKAQQAHRKDGIATDRASAARAQWRLALARFKRRCGAWWEVEPRVARMVYGVPSRLVKERIAGLGNAIVPQIAELIGLLIKASEN
jgi:DNA (cytosine-5)-methyltransferase 1